MSTSLDIDPAVYGTQIIIARTSGRPLEDGGPLSARGFGLAGATDPYFDPADALPGEAAQLGFDAGNGRFFLAPGQVADIHLLGLRRTGPAPARRPQSEPAALARALKRARTQRQRARTPTVETTLELQLLSRRRAGPTPQRHPQSEPGALAQALKRARTQRERARTPAAARLDSEALRAREQRQAARLSIAAASTDPAAQLERERAWRNATSASSDPAPQRERQRVRNTVSAAIPVAAPRRRPHLEVRSHT